jgi:hypothetical protein
MPAAAIPPTVPASATPAMPMPSLGELGGGLPSATGGLAGIGSRLADAIGGLLDRPQDALPEPAEVTEDAVEEDDEAPPDEQDDEAAADEDEPGEDEEDVKTKGGSDDETAELAETDEPAAEPVDACADEPVGEAPQPDPVPTPPPAPMPEPPDPVAEPPQDAEPVGAETPCEIAADELPQAGP